MDRGSFDALARLLATTPSRRAALGAVLAAGLTGTLGVAEAAKKDRGKSRKGRKSRKGKGAAQVSAEAADCLNPGPGSNMNGCDFSGRDFSGGDLSGSSMVGTDFTNAELVGTELHSSSMRNAVFRGADLECADLSASTLRNADFRGFDPLTGGSPTNLTLADLSSSGGCGTVQTNEFTVLCGTTWCDGTVRNDACPGGPPPGVCCVGAACPAPEGLTDEAVCQADGRCCVPNGGSAGGVPGEFCLAANCCAGACFINTLECFDPA